VVRKWRLVVDKVEKLGMGGVKGAEIAVKVFGVVRSD